MTHNPAATLTFTAQEVLPGTPYSDEPGHTVPPGWYVIGTYTDDPADGPAVVISIDHAIDRDAALIDGAIARHIADLLTAPAHEEPMPANATARTTDGTPGARCPSCREDGGYGDTVSHTEYRCPVLRCRLVLERHPALPPAAACAGPAQPVDLPATGQLDQFLFLLASVAAGSCPTGHHPHPVERTPRDQHPDTPEYRHLRFRRAVTAAAVGAAPRWQRLGRVPAPPAD